MSRHQTIPHDSHWGAFRAEVRDGRVVGVVPFEHDPDPTPIIHSIPDALYDKSRVRQPFVRRGWLEHGPGGERERRGGDEFVPVSWERALDLVAKELLRVRETHGNASIFAGSYGWSSAGRFHHAKTQLQRFMNGFGGFTGQIHNYSYAAALALLPHVVGSVEPVQGPVSSWDGIVGNAELIVSFGGIPLKNSQLDSGGLGAHVGAGWLRAAKDAGIRFVNIGPVRDDVPDFVEPEWIPIRPNTDTAMMLALAWVLRTEGLYDRAFLDRYCTGYDRFEPYLLGESDGRPKTPEWAEAITGVPAERIVALAREMAGKRTLINTAWGVQRADHGEQPFWMTVVLASMLGQIGLPGGGFGFGYGSTNGMGNPRERVPSPALPTGANPIDSYIPVARISDLLLNPGAPYDFNGERRVYPDIRLVYWCGGNPFHHHQDLGRLVQAFQRPETVIVHEPWWTATARHADIVLPATTTLERNDIGAGSRDRWLLAMHKAIDPVGEARSDFDIFSGIAARVGTLDAFAEGRDERAWLEHLYNVTRQLAARREVELPSFAEFWETGHVEIPAPKQPYVLFGDYREAPGERPLNTPSGKIEVFSERIAGFAYDDCPGHPTWLEPVEWLGSDKAGRWPLHMISNQPRTRLHGQLDNGGISRASKIRGREPVWLHPTDAAARDISDGDVVRVFNERGSTLAGAVVTELVMPGVIQLATGAWYDPAEPGRPEALDKHGNPNMLTLDKGTSRLGQGPIAHSALVEVERYDAALPPITAWDAPAA